MDNIRNRATDIVTNDLIYSYDSTGNGDMDVEYEKYADDYEE